MGMFENLNQGTTASQGQNVSCLIKNVLDDYRKGRAIDKMDVYCMPDQDKIKDITDKLLRIIYPGYYRDRLYKGFNEVGRLSVALEDVMFNLQKQIALVLPYNKEYQDMSEQEIDDRAGALTAMFIRQIPKIREYLDTDIQALFDGDPAASGTDEIVLSYPGLYAITLNRIAHELFLLGIPFIPRMITENAHSKTGIDIHPGATLGKYFMIDHGTGIVVGSTTIIGDHVKVYQGVTIGALSTRQGQKLRGKKRHPTIEDNVTIYSGASILGGETIIGHDTVIGSNAFITSSVAPNSRISIQSKETKVDMASKEKQAEKNVEDETWFYII